ncbi:MAG: ATP-binding protein [Gammaproteobacteria bacterium]|nr:ATP-binding protein [Gammaproteobacteria bacterium]
MKAHERKIAFKLSLPRMLELLADEIYQSPLSLLRENAQNAFDAILMRKAASGQEFSPSIDVSVDGSRVVVRDNGIGMSAEEMENNFWHAGKSSKNTDAARAAGVVGTFGIGAMANFGVADELRVESESAVTGERTTSSVKKSELDTEAESIRIVPMTATGEAGTEVEAQLSLESTMSIEDARRFLHSFVEFVDIPVLFNGEQLSGSKHRATLPSERHTWMERVSQASLGGALTGDLELMGMASGELRVAVEGMFSSGSESQYGTIVLVQGRNVVRTLRSGFGLATVAVQSVYQWGGVIDLPFLRPTAGREALDASSNQMIQHVIGALDELVSPLAAKHQESFANESFLHWIQNTKRFGLCGDLEVELRPEGQQETLAVAVERQGLRYYSGRDQSVIATYASDDEPLLVLSRRNPRRNCELAFLRLKGVSEVDTKPRVQDEMDASTLSFSHAALATRVGRILEEDYFLPAEIRFGTITAGLPILVTKKSRPVVIFLDPSSTSVAPLVELYREDFDAFGPFVKDFIRSTVFPRISSLVPSSTKEGSEAFLRHLRSNREWFEYELDDKAELTDIFDEIEAGRLSFTEARKRLANTDRSFVEVSRAGTAPLESVVREVGTESPTGPVDVVVDPHQPMPGIDRREEETNALILTSEIPLNGYRCFLSITDRVQRDKGHFFKQPHSTEIVWGGRKVLFVFQHHSRQFGLYYDILCPGLVGSGSGGGPRATSTILAKNRTFIPIPDEIRDEFVPISDERKRLEVRCDILHLLEK